MDYGEWIKLIAELGGWGAVAFILLKSYKELVNQTRKNHIAERTQASEDQGEFRVVLMDMYGQMLTIARQSVEAITSVNGAITSMKDALEEVCEGLRNISQGGGQ